MKKILMIAILVICSCFTFQNAFSFAVERTESTFAGVMSIINSNISITGRRNRIIERKCTSCQIYITVRYQRIIKGGRPAPRILR